jgi:MFS superfamily sulfate permease-like transporter
LPVLTATPVQADNMLSFGWELLKAAPHWNLTSLTTGLLALIALCTLRRQPAIPAALLVLASGIAASWLLDLRNMGVATVGVIDVHLAWPGLVTLPVDTLSRMAQLVVPLVLILFAESWGTMRTLALRHGDAINPDRELGALGAANLASALAQGMPVGAGFSAGSANEAAGATTRRAGLFAAIALGLFVAFASPLIALLPSPVLAAVVIAALTHALDPAPFIRLWRLGRDQYLALAATAGVLLLGVLDGMMLAIALSIMVLIRRLATPRLIVLGQLGASHDYVDISRHPDAVSPPGIEILRPTEPLFFANAERLLANITARLREAPGIRAGIVSLEESYDIDSTTLEALLEFSSQISGLGIALHFARVHDRVRDVLAAAGADQLLSTCHYSVDDAVNALRRPSDAR